jgi:hypothetical protein
LGIAELTSGLLQGAVLLARWRRGFGASTTTPVQMADRL